MEKVKKYYLVNLPEFYDNILNEGDFITYIMPNFYDGNNNSTVMKDESGLYVLNYYPNCSGISIRIKS